MNTCPRESHSGWGLGLIVYLQCLCTILSTHKSLIYLYIDKYIHTSISLYYIIIIIRNLRLYFSLVLSNVRPSEIHGHEYIMYLHVQTLTDVHLRVHMYIHHSALYTHTANIYAVLVLNIRTFINARTHSVCTGVVHCLYSATSVAIRPPPLTHTHTNSHTHTHTHTHS